MTMSGLNFKLIRLGSCLHDQWLKEKTIFQKRLNAERHAEELLDSDEVSAGDFLDHLLDVHRRMCRVCNSSTQTANSKTEAQGHARTFQSHSHSQVTTVTMCAPSQHSTQHHGTIIGEIPCRNDDITTESQTARILPVATEKNLPITQNGANQVDISNDHPQGSDDPVENDTGHRSPIWISDEEESKLEDNESISHTDIPNVTPLHLQTSSDSTQGQRSELVPTISISESWRDQPHGAEKSNETGSKFSDQNRFLCWDCGQLFNNIESLQQHCNISNCSQQRNMLNFCHSNNSVLSHEGSHDSSLSIESVKVQEPHKATQTTNQNYLEMRNPTKVFPCDICNRTFPRKRNMERHRRIHTNDKPYICGICNKAFTQLASLKEHRHFHDNVRQYSCTICSKKFKYRSNLYDHRKSTHRVVTKIVNSASSFQPSVVQGISQVTTPSQEIHDPSPVEIPGIEETVRPIACSTERPQEQAESESSVAIHHVQSLNTEPGFYMLEDPKKYVCDICSRPFTQSNNLKRHRRTHTKEKPYNCDVCFKSFTQSNTMKEHKKIHSDQKAYGCTFCGKRFRQRSSLDKHKKAFATTEDVACALCGQKFQQKCTLRDHMANHVIFLPQ